MGLRLGVTGSLASVVGHAALVGLLCLIPTTPRVTLPPQAPTAPIPAQLSLSLVLVPSIAVPVVADVGPEVPLPLGPADVVVASSSSPLPNADIDVPDPRRAAPGGGASGATEAWTARHDREELRAQPWNDPARYRIPRVMTARDRATSEAVARLPDPGIGASSSRHASRRARRATLQASAQTTGVTQAGQAGASDESRRAEGGAADPARQRPLVETGVAAVEADRHGGVRDDTDAAQASDERHPEPFDLTTARAGGEDGEGVAGSRLGPGSSAESDRGTGDGASTLAVPFGRGPVASRARLQDPYLRAMYARVLERVVWPRKLALAFEQGEVIVRFTLGDGGAVEGLRVDRSSGFSEFDDAVVTAVRTAGPFGPVPEALSPRGQKLQVRAPFVFANPMIR